MSEVRAARVGRQAGATAAPVGERGGQAQPVTVTGRPEIADVAQAPADVPLVLEKSGTDGLLRPETLAQAGLLSDADLGTRVASLDPGTGDLEVDQLPDVATRQPRWFYGEGPPPPDLGATKGDLYLDQAAGLLYQLN